jgi:hypothetical protein
MTAPPTNPCPGCGFKAGRTACQDLFNDVALRIRALAWTGSMQTWRLLHDVYDIQHEADFCGRYRGLIMHLGGVCLALEHGGEERDYKKLQKYIELDLWKDKPYPPEPGIPAARGVITVGNLEEAESPERLIAGVDRWARSAWEAYRPLQPIAREWVKAALKIN